MDAEIYPRSSTTAASSHKAGVVSLAPLLETFPAKDGFHSERLLLSVPPQQSFILSVLALSTYTALHWPGGSRRLPLWASVKELLGWGLHPS